MLYRSLFLDQNLIFSDLFQAQFFRLFYLFIFSALLTQTSLKVWVPNQYSSYTWHLLHLG